MNLDIEMNNVTDISVNEEKRVEIIEDSISETDIETKEVAIEKKSPTVFSKKEKPKTKKCRVLSYNSHSGVLAFLFESVSCQVVLSYRPNIVNGFIDVKYSGTIEKDLRFHF